MSIELTREGEDRKRHVRPVVFAALYLLLIPGFAGAYSALGGETFHDSNLQLENAFASDEEHLGRTLGGEITHHVTTTTWSTPTGELQLSRKSITVHSLELTPDKRLLLTVAGRLRVAGTHQGYSKSFATAVDVLLPQGAFKAKKLQGYLVSLAAPKAGSVVTPTGVPPMSLLFATPAGVSATPPAEGALPMSPATKQEIHDFSRSAQGDPAYGSNSFFRMIYMSATIVTTLGFGDITPVGTDARTFATLEAILGVVLIGLFLNGLARKWKAQE